MRISDWSSDVCSSDLDDFNRLFTTLIGSHEELLFLPDDTTVRMAVTPHPFGGLLMVFEDVTDRLSLERSYNTLTAVQQETLDKNGRASCRERVCQYV